VVKISAIIWIAFSAALDCLFSFCHIEGIIIIVLALVLFALGSAFLFVSHAQRLYENGKPKNQN